MTFFGRLGCFHFADGKQHGALVKHLPDSSWNMTNTGSLKNLVLEDPENPAGSLKLTKPTRALVDVYGKISK